MQQDLIWKLPSNSGWDEFRCDCVSFSPGDHVVVHFTCRGEFWDRTADFTDEGYSGAELKEDSAVQLPQVIIPRGRLAHLRDEIADWLEEPNDLSIDLGIQHQIVTLDFGQQEGVIRSMAKPVCRLTYDTSRLKLVCRFVTDQSCIRIMLTALSQWLRHNPGDGTE